MTLGSAQKGEVTQSDSETVKEERARWSGASLSQLTISDTSKGCNHQVSVESDVQRCGRPLR